MDNLCFQIKLNKYYAQDMNLFIYYLFINV